MLPRRAVPEHPQGQVRGLGLLACDMICGVCVIVDDELVCGVVVFVCALALGSVRGGIAVAEGVQLKVPPNPE